MLRRPRRRGVLGAVWAGALLFFGAAALGVSLLLPGAAASEDAGPDILTADLRRAGSADHSSPLRSLDAEGPAAAQATPGPKVKAPAPGPAEAQAVTRTRALGAGQAAAKASRADPPAAGGGPYSVAIVPSASGLDAVAASLETELQTHGIQARRTGLDRAGRPDSVIVLSAGEGDGVAAWYCESEAGSRELAATVLTTLTRALPYAGSGREPPALDCRALHTGRSRTPAVLIELPAALDARSVAPALAEGLSAYFSRFGPAGRKARAEARLAWPAAGAITSYFGPAHPLGIDIGQREGNVAAATDGTVFFAGGSPCCSYGRFVVIDSAGGVRTLYAHLDSLAVKQGDRVKQGQAIGAVGCSGACYGTHLHFEVIDGGVRRDPLDYLP